MRVIPLKISFEEAWDKFPVKCFFMESYITKDSVEDYFKKTRLSLFLNAPSVFQNI